MRPIEKIFEMRGAKRVLLGDCRPVQLASGRIQVTNVGLDGGDEVALSDVDQVRIRAEAEAELLRFDLR